MVAYRSWIGAVCKARNTSLLKTSVYYKYLGCEIDVFVAHVEKLMSKDMTWGNYGVGGQKWSLDHKRPLCSFDFSDENQWYECFDYKNVRPLWNGFHYVKSRSDKKMCNELRSTDNQCLSEIVGELKRLTNGSQLSDKIHEIENLFAIRKQHILDKYLIGIDRYIIKDEILLDVNSQAS